MENEFEPNERDLELIEQLYNDEKLDLDNMKKQPVLKPLIEINKSFGNFQLVIRRAMWEYEQNKTAIDSMLESNPIYSQTMIVHKIQSMLNYIKQIIHSQNLQKEDMKNAIKEMIDIVKNNYMLVEEESNEEIIKEDKIEINVREKEPMPTSFSSSLIDKKLPIPQDKQKKETYIPLEK